ncbi:MAG: hypothetical protein KDD98_02050 [Sphingomonadaceae bacterium]|nr:hypothetical protein [Sphingomonadaceae bacterium]
MKILPPVLALTLASACSATNSGSTTFIGQIDEAAYAKYYQAIPRDELRAECGNLTLSDTELNGLIEAYDEVSSGLAYNTLTVTPCVIRDSFVFEGRAASFTWYPSGYLAINFPNEEGTEGRYYICAGASGPENEGVITVDEVRKLMCK